ncbi:hypothetical protein AcV5_008379 [Taiwanofungus camphoratus]|nr:hypothetical protein AcV5_008379 [Antrodia cinnamomea]
MTVFLPLEASSPFPHSPSFLVPSAEPSAHVKKVIKAIMKARRIAVVCGTQRSLWACFLSEGTTSLFCQMIAQLYELSQDATPTAFHQVLRALDDRRKLLRVYTQNIDALEMKTGLTFGVPEVDGKRYKPRSTKGKPENGPEEAGPSTRVEPLSNERLPSPPAETPRCIPLHGTLQSMHCQTCTHSFPLRNHLETLTAGRPPYCPECTALEETRQLVGKRSRGVGKLRPSVVLYNEMHKDGEEVGDVVRRDLIGSSKGKGRAGADLLLVVGTSLRVPGTKRIVREFSKAVHSRASTANSSQNESSATSTLGLATPTPSPRRSPADDEEPPITTVYLNLDFPVPTREWEGVFDVWIRGDAQEFAQMLHDEMEREARAKEAASERKRKREEAALAAKLDGSEGAGKAKSSKKRKNASGLEAVTPSTKKRKVDPLTPISLIKPSASSKKHEDTTLPTLPKDNARPNVKTKLTIKIPAKRFRYVPEVVITTPVPKKPKLRTPSPAPSDSPLTPAPSPSPRHRRTSSTGKEARRTIPHNRPPPERPSSGIGRDTKLDARAGHGHNVNVSRWDCIDASSDLTDDEMLDDAVRSFVRYGSRAPGG